MRRKDREITDISEILNIIDKTKILHLGLFDKEYPYIVPMHYGYIYDGESIVFYMHSAKDGLKLDLIRSNSNVFVELECDVEAISGGDIPCEYGSAFSSVMGKGKAEITEFEQDKIRGLELLMKHQTGREFAIDEKMASSVEVIKVVVGEFTAKSKPMSRL